MFDKKLEQFFEGLGNALAEPRTFFDLVWLDIFPYTTRFIDDWETQFGVLDNGLTTETERRDRLNNEWKLKKINPAEQIEEALRGAGFDVYVHEWWVPGTEPAIGVKGQATPRNPFNALYGYGVECGEDVAECGEAEALCGGRFGTDIGYVLVNKITTLQPDILPRCGEPLAQCGEDTAQCGAFINILEIQKQYTIPTDPAYWPYFIYIGDETFPDFATVPASRREEFENLCLKICQCQHWLGMLINYI